MKHYRLYRLFAGWLQRPCYLTFPLEILISFLPFLPFKIPRRRKKPWTMFDTSGSRLNLFQDVKYLMEHHAVSNVVSGDRIYLHFSTSFFVMAVLNTNPVVDTFFLGALPFQKTNSHNNAFSSLICCFYRYHWIQSKIYVYSCLTSPPFNTFLPSSLSLWTHGAKHSRESNSIDSGLRTCQARSPNISFLPLCLSTSHALKIHLPTGYLISGQRGLFFIHGFICVPRPTMRLLRILYILAAH